MKTLSTEQRVLLERMRGALHRPDPDAGDPFLLLEMAEGAVLQHPGFPMGIEPVGVEDIIAAANPGEPARLGRAPVAAQRVGSVTFSWTRPSQSNE